MARALIFFVPPASRDTRIHGISILTRRKNGGNSNSDPNLKEKLQEQKLEVQKLLHKL